MVRYILFFLLIFSTFSAFAKGWKPVYPPFDRLAAKCQYDVLLLEKSPEYKTYIKNMYAMADRRKDLPALRWRAIYWDAFLHWRMGRGDITEKLARKAISIVDTVDYEYDYHRLRTMLDYCKEKKRSLFDAYKAYHEDLRYFESVGDSMTIANLCITIGNIFLTLEEPHKAYDYLHRADVLFGQCGRNDYRIKNRLNLADIIYFMGNKRKAFDMLQDIAKHKEAQADTSFMLQVYNSMPAFSINSRQFGFYARKAYRFAEDYGKRGAIMDACVNLATAFLNEGQADSSLVYYRRAKSYYATSGDVTDLPQVLSGMSDAFSKLGQWDSAYVYLADARRMDDSLRKAADLPAIYLQENRTAIDGYEAQLERQRDSERQHRTVFVLILIVVILVCGFICYWLWSERRKALIKKRLKEAENNELETRLANEQLNFRLDMDSKNRQLVSSQLMLIEKNKMLDELLQRIDNGGEGVEARRMVLEMKSQMRAHGGDEDEWRAFRTHFEQVHPGFFTLLKDLYPDLTEYELRLCAYIRTGMYGKQIAMMLSIQPESIKKSRTRLRKKLRLRSDESLEDYLRNLNVKIQP